MGEEQYGLLENRRVCSAYAMEEADQDLCFDAVHQVSPSLVSFLPFSPVSAPLPRRLSGVFVPRNRPLFAQRKLAWISLDGRVLNAEEASSVTTIGGGLSPEEAIAWELFSPVHRFLIVAVIGVAVVEAKKNRQIWRLKKAVELRDQVLLSMQQKLDNLCDELNQVKDHPGSGGAMVFTENVDLICHEALGSNKIKFIDCGCWLCDQHRSLVSPDTTTPKSGSKEEMTQYKFPVTYGAEPEERRMSDLSDWASSVTSAAEIQINSLAIEQDMLNLKKDCEEKDATIEELTNLLRSSDMAGSKRILELEDIIRRKNLIISKLKKDMVVLEHQVMQLTRFRRASSATPVLNISHPPHMSDNLLYDMETSTSPSSSDSDSSPLNSSISHKSPVQNKVSALITNHKSLPPKSSSFSKVRPRLHSQSQVSSPLEEISINRRSETSSRISRRHIQPGSKGSAAQRRFI